jgi:3-oxoadipate:acetyl-CoA acetyltransferase
MPDGGRAHLPFPLRPYPPLIVNAALTGMVGRRARVPHLPVTAEQVVADAEACFRAGATIVHLHARRADEEPEWRREGYGEIVAELRRRCPGLVLCVSTSGRTYGELDKRADVLLLEGDERPDFASLTLGSLNFRDTASVNAPQTIVALADRMRAAGLRPELEVFDTGMAAVAHRLLADGLVEPPLYANLLLGSPNTAPATARDLAFLADALPDGTVWAAAGIGAFQLPMNAIAVFMGGHVRTGLEDSPYLSYATREPATNEQLVQRAVALAEMAGRRVATTAEARAIIGLPPP